MALHVIVGKGPVGSTTATQLADRGHTVRILSRSGGSTAQPPIAHPSIEQLAVDAADERALTAAADGAAVLYNCANPLYHRWATDWPPIATALLGAAERTGAVLVTMSNLYGYGPVDGPLTESLPLAAPGTKGKVRAGMWREALTRHEAGRVRVTEARASDFFGPEVLSGGQFGDRVMPRMLAGRPVQLLGRADAPHSWTYIPDVARALVRLGTDERAWGRAWHVPTEPPLSARDLVARLARAAGVDQPTVRSLPWVVIRTLGVFSPLLRELEEVRYQHDRPFVLDSTAYTATFGEHATPFDQALAETVAWWRRRLAGSAPDRVTRG
ncbi:MAG: NAD-dependent epimerase/dehydratase family protein [Actinobacteria bacterium]|nr:NAD-dependent epimerase/dehydratase family protein [Actinomycetota bacterium]